MGMTRITAIIAFVAGCFVSYEYIGFFGPMLFIGTLVAITSPAEKWF